MNSGRVDNHVNFKDYNDNGKYQVTFMHELHPRYTGEKFSIWKGWEVSTDVLSRSGNILKAGRSKVRLRILRIANPAC